MAEAPPGDNLYISNLPAEADDKLLREIFGDTIKSCRVLPSKTPGEGTCVALVRFNTLEEAKTVRETLDGVWLPGTDNVLSIRYNGKPWDNGGGAAAGGKGGYGKAASKGGGWKATSPYNGGGGGGGVPEKDHVLITGLPPGVDDDWIKQSFSEYGAEVKSSQVIPAKEEDKPWSAKVRFASAEEAELVKTNFHGADLEGNTIKIEYVCKAAPSSGGGAKGAGAAGAGAAWGAGAWGGAATKGKGGWGKDMKGWGKGAGKGGTKGGGKSMPDILKVISSAKILPGVEMTNDDNCLWIGGLPPDCEDVHLYRLCAPFGAIPSAGLTAMKNPDGQCKGFGFVNFIDADALQMAHDAINGLQLPDGTMLKAAIKKPKGATE